MIGNTLSHYRVDAELGRGGMGIVYHAQDTKLNRDVAIKVLPSAALATEDDRARFYREAQSAAQLHHAHIATIFEIDEAVPSNAPHGTQPSPFIVMEYVEGETLDARIKKGPLKLSEAIRIATEVAGALGLAHEKNIVHRDVKAANVMLDKKGSAKVLDFGLAKTSQSTKLTQMGSTLGTVAYMSPEQARGDEVDARTDLWALGVVLYEMIAGRNPFEAGYEQAVVYSILNTDPEPLTAVRSGVPMELESIIEKCLRKESKHRYQTASGLIADLESVSKKLELGTTTRTHSVTSIRDRAIDTGGPSIGVSEGQAREIRSRLTPMLMLACAGGLVLGGLLVGFVMKTTTKVTPSSASAEVVRSTIVLPDEFPFFMNGATLGLEISALDLSQDGSMLVYVTRYEDTSALAIREMEDGSSRLLDGTLDAYTPRFSPDGKWIVYLASGAMYRVPPSGGRPKFITNVSDATGQVWMDDGFIYWGEQQGSALMRTTPEGVREEMSSGDCNCGLPSRGPGGIGAVVSGRDREIVQWIRDKGESFSLDVRGYNVRYLPQGHVVYLRTGTMLASRYDRETGNAIGDERTILDDIRTGSILRSGHYALSHGGTFVYAAGAPSGLVNLVIRNADGTEEEVGLPAGVFGPVDVSSDGRRILAVSYDRGGQVVQFDTQSGSDRIVPSRSSDALWFPDGKTVAYVVLTASGSRIHALNSDTGQDRVLFESDGVVRISNLSPDGRFLAYRMIADGDESFLIRNLEDGSETIIGNPSVGRLWAADWSRDGRLFSYTRVDDSGSSIVVEPFPRDGSSWMISPSGGEEAEWLPDRNAIVYRNDNTWYIVEYSDDDTVAFSEPKVLFSGPYVNVAGMEYRMMSGGRALLQRSVNTATLISRIEVISGFDRLLEQAFE